jgi:vanillate O-demethylase monooxygenase subunit
MEPGRITYDAPARLINDNLLDLSHVGFVHRNSFAGGNDRTAQGWAASDTVYKTLPRGVRVSRLIQGVPPAYAAKPTVTPAMVDVYSSYDFLVPGIFLQTTRRFVPGAYEIDEDGVPQGDAIFETFTCQAVTPRTEDSATYFFAYGPWAAEAERKQFYAELGLRAFDEDRQMIEAQHQVMKAASTVKVMPMAMDKGILLYDAVVRRMQRGSADAAVSSLV